MLVPRRRAASISKIRSGVASARRLASSSSSSASRGASAGSALSPSLPCSSDRMAFCRDSGNVRPMAITSPTDCMRVPSRPSAPGSFSKAQRGIFVTT